MSTIAKAVQRMQRSRRNVRWDELCRVLRYCGYEAIVTEGSHHRFEAEGKSRILVVKPHGGERFCHPADVDKALAAYAALDPETNA